MGKKNGIFTEGQLVYAKVKGYSPWPAKIIKVIGKHKYGVYFYGTGESGNCKSEDLDAYDERNRGRFNTERQMKKQEYKEAVEQIEMAMYGNDPAPVYSNLNENNESVKLETVDDTMKTNDISQDVEDFDPEESQLQIAENVPKSTPAPTKRKLPKQQQVQSPLAIEQHETKENDEKVSRSGRKIKEKKINNDEMDPDEFFTQSRKRLKVDDSNRTKNSAVVPPKDSTINDFVISKIHILQDPVRKEFLTTQFEMCQTILDIKQALGLETVEVDRALTACNNFKEKVLPNITRLMLLKYSSVVTTIKRIRNYIGNVELWKLDEEPLKNFEAKAKQIREIACEIYSSLKRFFPDAPENSSFIQYFTEEHQKFLEKYQKLDVSDLFEALTFEELDAFLNKHLNNDDAQVPQLPEESAQLAD
ncbi:hypothetical protein PVAND_008253 [Polypedilum vanderplanki]|uniref:PWWP domain-containing protein n=1 Tax=Polypedilum vanderplanki TaxID=319348 RepID=A0A9J6C9M6_POLVA|nr:hypothetical protein PVAND_008253 [Polypedilum vanderplanki]